MTARWMVGLLALALGVGAGCGTKEGQRLVSYDPDKRLQEKKAGEDGRYTLHMKDRPDVTFRVLKGERVGFRRTGDGYVEAYAGDNPGVELERAAARGAYWEFDEKAKK